MGWWLDPQVWIVGQLAFWSIVLYTDAMRKQSNNRKR